MILRRDAQARAECPPDEDGEFFFSTDAIAEARDFTKGNSRHTIAYMTPAQFLGLAEPGHCSWKTGEVKKLIDEGVAFSSIPMLQLDATGRAVGHEGRHRMRALEALGITKVPVRVSSITMRWKRQAPEYAGTLDYDQKLPTHFIAYGGTPLIPFPSREEIAAGDIDITGYPFVADPAQKAYTSDWQRAQQVTPKHLVTSELDDEPLPAPGM